jgi:hypothetical protein
VDAAFGDFVVPNVEQQNEEKIESIATGEVKDSNGTKQAFLEDARQKIRALTTRLN